MKQLGFLLLLTLTASAQAQCISQAISGGVIVNENGYFLVNPITQTTSAILPSTASAKQALEQLNSQDYLSGFGCASIDSVILNRVEFVGLHRLIGIWKSNQAVNVAFRDYSRVSFGRRIGQGNLFRYALAPNQGRTWRVFLSDDLSVTMGSITIDQDDAVMDLYDPDTGNLEQSLSLKKVL